MASTSKKATLSSFSAQALAQDSVSVSAPRASMVRDWSSDQPPKNAAIASLIRPVDPLAETSLNPSSKGTFFLLYVCFILFFMFLCVVLLDHLRVCLSLLLLSICHIVVFLYSFLVSMSYLCA